MVDQEVQSTGTQNKELTTAVEAEEISELDAEKDAFSLDFLGDSDSGSGLESEDEQQLSKSKLNIDLAHVSNSLVLT